MLYCDKSFIYFLCKTFDISYDNYLWIEPILKTKPIRADPKSLSFQAEPSRAERAELAGLKMARLENHVNYICATIIY